MIIVVIRIAYYIFINIFNKLTNEIPSFLRAFIVRSFSSVIVVIVLVFILRYFTTVTSLFNNIMTDSNSEKIACKRSKTYNKISDVQRLKLQQFYDDGMKSCASVHLKIIRKAAEETQLTIKQVKVGYILNYMFYLFLYYVNCFGSYLNVYSKQLSHSVLTYYMLILCVIAE